MVQRGRCGLHEHVRESLGTRHGDAAALLDVLGVIARQEKQFVWAWHGRAQLCALHGKFLDGFRILFQPSRHSFRIGMMFAMGQQPQ